VNADRTVDFAALLDLHPMLALVEPAKNEATAEEWMIRCVERERNTWYLVEYLRRSPAPLDALIAKVLSGEIRAKYKPPPKARYSPQRPGPSQYEVELRRIGCRRLLASHDPKVREKLGAIVQTLRTKPSAPKCDRDASALKLLVARSFGLSVAALDQYRFPRKSRVRKKH